MRRPVAAALAAIALASGAAGCGTFAVQPFATLADIRGPWRAEPLAIDQATRAAAEGACMDARQRAGPDNAPLDRLVLVDARGQSRLALIYAGAGRAFMRCDLRMDARGNVEIAGGWAQQDAGPVALLAQDGLEIVQSGGVMGDPNLASYVTGRIGQAVTGVRVAFPGGPAVIASIGGGWYTAWWPSDEVEFVVEAYDSTGSKIAEADQ